MTTALILGTDLSVRQVDLDGVERGIADEAYAQRIIDNIYTNTFQLYVRGVEVMNVVTHLSPMIAVRKGGANVNPLAAAIMFGHGYNQCQTNWLPTGDSILLGARIASGGYVPLLNEQIARAHVIAKLARDMTATAEDSGVLTRSTSWDSFDAAQVFSEVREARALYPVENKK